MTKEDLVKRFKVSKDFNEHLLIAEQHIKLAYDQAMSETYDIAIPPPEYEIWRNVKGFEGIYQISSFGRLKALERFFIKKNSSSNGRKAVYKEENIRPLGWQPFGYKKINLSKNGVTTHITIHRLVAQHFVLNDNPKIYKQIGHLDNNPKNPKWNNLKWETQKMNIQYAVECGRFRTGSENNKTKLKESDIPIIRKLILDGISAINIGKMFNVSHQPITQIKYNRTWKHIK